MNDLQLKIVSVAIDGVLSSCLEIEHLAIVVLSSTEVIHRVLGPELLEVLTSLVDHNLGCIVVEVDGDFANLVGVDLLQVVLVSGDVSKSRGLKIDWTLVRITASWEGLRPICTVLKVVVGLLFGLSWWSFFFSSFVLSTDSLTNQ